MAASTCDCLVQKLPAEGQKQFTKDQAKTTIVQCFAVSLGKDLKSLQQVFGPNAMNDKEVMNQLGRDMAGVMLQSCPTFMTYSMVMAGSEETEAVSTAATTGQTIGQLGTLGGTGVATLNIAVSKSENAKFVWGRHFPKDDELLGQLEKLKGHQVRVSWQEVEVLQPETKRYNKLREITGVEIL